MVIGLRMGLTALNALNNGGWFGLTCVAMLRCSPPDSCVLDGIQSSSGCTMGKNNISVIEGNGVSVTFQSGLKTRQITLKPEIYEKIKKSMSSDAEHTIPDHEDEVMVSHLIEADEEELFVITLKL